ncbi:interleukin-12 receptor subunit beta-2-like [Chanos chanos]|uniref:Interleukin-12 receptor subunit beta-2-like n=1 Tax=Chanos chanos TaxID=29144 RepID=A0A6J2WS10_CHACN|nr:interleukin-12 receptor subunit beta-2-like [Chanos chanos]
MPPKGCDWLNLLFLLFLVPRACEAEKHCTAQSSLGHVVPVGSNFNVSCIFQSTCTQLIFQNGKLKSTTEYQRYSEKLILSVKNLTANTTFTCRCEKAGTDPCGIDIGSGYPPDVPRNLTCVRKGEFRNVTCTWIKGRETNLWTTAQLWSSASFNICEEAYSGSVSATFTIPGNETLFSVWVRTSNTLGSATSEVLRFSLSDIVKPAAPKITEVKCSARHCVLHLKKAQSVQLVEIRYKEDSKSKWMTPSFNRTHSESRWRISSLLPYRLYQFQARVKPSNRTGFWSEWSKAVHNKTDEEAPAGTLDAWYTESLSQSRDKTFTLFWKELSVSKAGGKILGYRMTIVDLLKKTKVKRQLKTSMNSSRLSCSYCNISLTAFNSKGHSPPLHLNLPLSTVHIHQPVSHKCSDNHTIALWWSHDVAPTGPIREYLVEWYPRGHREDLQWARIQPNQSAYNIQGLRPCDCYDGSVVALYGNGASRLAFRSIHTWQSAPRKSPALVDVNVSQSDGVLVSWKEIARDDRGGCLTKYTIYLENGEGKTQTYDVNASQTEFVIRGLDAGASYKLQISAWTNAGEGPKGSVRSFFTEPDMTLVIVVGSVILLVCFLLLCACQFSSVRQRVSRCCYCLFQDVVLDPANSTWAKEYKAEKGEASLQLYLSDSSMSEEEPETVEVQEVPKLPPEVSDAPSYPTSTLSPPSDDTEGFRVTIQPNLSPELLTPSPYSAKAAPCTYLKSFSQESGTSDNTQESRNTDITVDYISSHCVLSDAEEEIDEEDDKDCINRFGFFPSLQSPFLGPLVNCGGKLTLDTVKIDCSDFLDL